MKLKITTALVSLGLGTALLSGCGQQTEADLIAEAQLCLDKATASTAQNCASKIKSLTSQQAYIIRCSADFIEVGFDSPSKLVDALNAMTSSTSGATSLLAALAFTSHPTNGSTIASASQNADQTFTYCQQSGQKGLSMIAMLAKTATQVAGLGGISLASQPTAGQIQTAITALVSSGTADTTVGGAVQAVYSSTCATGSVANQDMCDALASAATSASIDITTATPAQIGSAVLAWWNAHH